MSDVQGLAALEARWSKIPESVEAEVRAVLEQIAGQIVAEMKSVAPKGATGRVAASIDWTWGDAPAGSFTIGTVGGSEYAALRITIYAGGGHAFYARYLEFGTSKMSAQPFFFPVWRTRRRGVKSKISRAITKAIRSS